MLVRIRLTVPDRPGALGLVTSTIGSAGADVVQVEVLSAEGGRATDDVHVSVATTERLERLRERLDALPGVAVEACQHPAPPVTGHAELELVGRLLADPARLPATLADGAVAAFGADWAQVLAYPDATPATGTLAALLAASVGAPAHPVGQGIPLRLATPRLTGDDGRAYGGVAVAPLTAPVVLLLVREQGPTFHRSELWRLAEIARIAGTLLDRATPQDLAAGA
ncbi:ACT domain-containing protein [Thalassiella azotivora]